jgi:hypothetical protein
MGKPAPIGNLYALGNNGGRPVKLDPVELRDEFQRYIEHCDNEKVLLPNIAGFAVFAGINSNTFYGYKKKDSYSEIVAIIEDTLEDRAINCKADAKSIFYLKNKFGYKDKQEIETTTTKQDITMMSDEDKQKRIDELRAKLAAK